MLNKNEILEGALLALKPEEMLQQVELTIKQKPEFIMALRNGTFLPLLKQENFHLAGKVNNVLLESMPSSTMLLKDRVLLSIKVDTNDLIIEKMSAYLKECVDGTDYALLNAVLKRLSKQPSQESLTVVEPLLNDSNLPNSSCYLALLVTSRLVQIDMANHFASFMLTRLCEDLSLIDSESNEMAVAVRQITDNELQSDTLQSLLTIMPYSKLNGNLKFEVARSLFKQDNQSRVLDELYDSNDASFFSNDIRVFDLVLRNQLARNNLDILSDIIGNITLEDMNAALLLSIAREFQANQRYEDAITIFEVIIKGDATSAIFRQYTSVLLEAGHTEKAQTFYKNWLEQRAASLPNTFKEGIDKIRTGSFSSKIPQSRKDFISKTLASSGIQGIEAVELEKQLDFTNELDHFLLDWMECNPHKVSEIAPFIENYDTVIQQLSERLEAGNGAFIATAHIGLLFSGPILLHLANLPGVWLASVPDLGDDRFAGHHISTANKNVARISRDVMRALNQNKIVSIAIDGHVASNKVELDLLGQKVSVSDFIPRAAWKKRIPSFFPTLVWKNNKISSELYELPSPNEGESVEEYTQRWCKEFEKRLCHFFVNRYNNLRATGGFWVNLDK